MIEVVPTVASGTGWSLCVINGRLTLIVDKPADFAARPTQVEVALPPEFVTELLRQKRQVRDWNQPE